MTKTAEPEKKPTVDETVMALITDVKRRRAEVAELSKPQWLTPCTLQLPGFDRLNIQIETDIPLLLVARAGLKRIRDTIDEGCKELEIEIDGPTSYQNYPIDDWVKDIEQRIKITQIKKQREKLNRLETRLNDLTSEEQRRELALIEIQKELEG